MQKISQGNQFQIAFCFLKELSSLQFDFAIFRKPSSQHTIETKCLELYTIDPEICSILIFKIRVWEQLPQHILFIIFQQKCSSCYILLTNYFIVQLPLLLEILGNMCFAIVSEPGCDVIDFEINLIFLMEPFFLHDQKVMTKT